MDQGSLKTLHIQSVAFDPFRVEIFLTGGDLSLEPTFAELDTFLDRIEVFWTLFLKKIEHESLLADTPLTLGAQLWEVDLNICSDATMRQMNQQYRQKDAATDVLSFPLVGDPMVDAAVKRMPVLQLGSIFISLDWAKAHLSEVTQVDEKDALSFYLLERFIHGLLHLMGVHHDTMPDFERVVRIQREILAGVFGVVDTDIPSSVSGEGNG